MTAAAPKYYHGNDLRPVRLEAAADEPCPVVPLDAYFTRRVHVFVYGGRLRSLLAAGWDVIHCWEEPYILAGRQVAAWTQCSAALVYRTAQSIDKKNPPPINWVERYSMNRSTGWICSGSLVARTFSARRGYDKPMAQIPLGVDPARFRPDPDAGNGVLRRLGWKPGPPVVGYLGRFVPAKGLGILTSSLDRLTGEWRALFVGTRPM